MDREETTLRIGLPLGVRDHLPGPAAVRTRVIRACMESFDRWGYRHIITPIFEYADVLERGSSASAIRFVEPTSGEVVALRPDITPQVARIVATRLGDLPGPLRLSYEGSVLRLAQGHSQRELGQVGVELIDAPQPEGDAEVMAMACEALQAAGARDLMLDVGHMGLVREALEGASAALRQALLRKDAREVERLARKEIDSQDRRRLIARLPRLHGPAKTVLAEAHRLSWGAARRAVHELEAALSALGDLKVAPEIMIDLGELRGVDYYTGIRFAAFAPGHGDGLCHGGRYDSLCGRYGREARAVGFAIDVDAVLSVLEAPGDAAKGLLVAGSRGLAPKVAALLRRQGERVSLYPVFPARQQTVRSYADRWGIAEVLWVESGGAVSIDPRGKRTRWSRAQWKAILGKIR